MKCYKLLIAAIGFVLASAVGCKEENSVTDLKLTPSSCTLTVGGSLKITVEVLPQDAVGKALEFTSSDVSVASVSGDGVISAITPGSAVVTVECGAVSAFCTVTVNEYVPVEQIILSHSEAEIIRTEALALKAIVLPLDASDNALVWNSSDIIVAEVSEDGIVSAIAVGEAVITASSGDIKAECRIKVMPMEVSSISLNKSELELSKGQFEQLVVSVLPDNADNMDITWSSDDEYVASVSEDGTVKAVSVGIATITATSSSGKSATCKVSVTGVPLIGDYFYSDATYSTELHPGKTPIGIVYYVGDPSVDDAALRKDHPECTHGLVVTLKNESSAWQEKFKTYGFTVGRWVEKNTEYVTVYEKPGIASNIKKMLGYNHTKALEAFNAAPENSDWPCDIVMTLGYFRERNEAPEGTSGWYLPSMRELQLMCWGNIPEGVPISDYTVMRQLLDDKMATVEGAKTFSSLMYWSSTEYNEEESLGIGFDSGQFLSASKASGGWCLRYILAF